MKNIFIITLFSFGFFATTVYAQTVYEIVEGEAPANRPPVIQNISLSTESSYVLDITLSGTDADGDVLSFDVNTSGLKNGTATVNGAVVTYTYQGSRSFDMTDGFTYTASDGKSTTAPATVTITIPKHNIVDSVVETVKRVTRRGGGGGGTKKTTTTTPTTPVVTAPVTVNQFTRVLAAGSSGADVKLLQQRLNTLGYTVAITGAGSRGNETTFFGQATRAALVRYQTAKGLPNKTGTLDLATQISLSTGTTVAAPVVPTTPVVTIPASTSFTRDLRVGMSGADVKRLQQILNKQGFVIATTGAGSPGLESTYFGPKTSTALSRLQRAKGLPVVGWAGPKTRAYLNSLPN